MSFLLGNPIPSLFLLKLKIKHKLFLFFKFHNFEYFAKNSETNINQNLDYLNLDDISGNPLFKEIFELPNGPRLYLILCKKNKKVYFGQSNNVIYRLGRHFEDLTNQIHDCKELQKDWDEISNSNTFSFVVLSISSQWKSEKLRKKKETELIQLNSAHIYNNIMSIGSTYLRAVSIKDKIFQSIAEAARELNISETTIRRNITNPKKVDWKDVVNGTSEIRNLESAKPIIVYGKLYRSIRQASIETKINRNTLTSHLKKSGPKFDYCCYLNEI